MKWQQVLVKYMFLGGITVNEKYFEYNSYVYNELKYPRLTILEMTLDFFDGREIDADGKKYRINKKTYRLDEFEGDGIKDLINGSVLIRGSVDVTKENTGENSPWEITVEVKNRLVTDITVFDHTEDDEILLMHKEKLVKTKYVTLSPDPSGNGQASTYHMTFYKKGVDYGF